MSAQVDVLAVDVRAVMERGVARAMNVGDGTAEARAACDAVGELINRDLEYDDALQALTELNRRIAEHGWMTAEHDALRRAGERLIKAANFRTIALRRVQGVVGATTPKGGA